MLGAEEEPVWKERISRLLTLPSDMLQYTKTKDCPVTLKCINVICILQESITWVILLSSVPASNARKFSAFSSPNNAEIPVFRYY